jgi:multidrug efflux system outer membrane protein
MRFLFKTKTMKRYLYFYIFFTIITLLSACKVSKDITVNNAPAPTVFRGADSSAAADSASIGNIKWQDFYTDTVLKQLIDSAIVNNYDMQIAYQNIQASQLLLKQVKWDYVPQVDLNVTANSDRPSDNSLNGLSLAQYNIGTNHIEDYNANLALSWEADIWGKIRNRQKSALATYLETAEARKFLQTNIVANVAQGYYNLLMLDAQLDIAQKNARLNDSTLQIIKLQFDAGQVTLLAVQQIEAQRQVALQLIPQFEQNIAIQENALRILTGALPDKVTRSAKLDDLVIADSLSAGLPSAIISRRPDVKSAELELDIANANVGITKAQLYPSLVISASGGVNSFKASNWFSVPASLFGIVGASVVQPLLDHKLLNTNYKVALVQREKVVIQFRQSVLNAVGEVSNALVSIDKLKAQQTIANDRVTTLQNATGNAQMLFKNGLANYLEVITAQSNVLQSELELASIKRDRMNAITELYRSLGGGWN